MHEEPPQGAGDGTSNVANERDDGKVAVEANAELEALANAIAEAAIKAGIIKPDTSLTGPQLIQVCDDLATAALAASQPKSCADALHEEARVLLHSAAKGRIRGDFVAVEIATEAVATALSKGKGTSSLTEDFVQPVPDHCDRVMWRGRFYHLGLPRLELAPRPMDTVPRDGTMFRVLVQFSHNSMGEGNPHWTLGICDPDTDAGEGLTFVGWNLAQECFTEGDGTALGWLPLLDDQEATAG